MALRSLRHILNSMHELLYVFTYKWHGKQCTCSSPTYELAYKEHEHHLAHPELFTEVSEIHLNALDL